MALVDKLIEQLNNRGLKIVPAEEPGKLILRGPEKEKTPEIWAAVKRFKAELLRVYGRPKEAGTLPEPEAERRAGDAGR